MGSVSFGARFVASCLAQGEDLARALLALRETFDGFYTLLVTSANGFAVLRDPIACRPAVIAETYGWVAMASEFRALPGLPGIESPRLYESLPLIAPHVFAGEVVQARAEP